MNTDLKHKKFLTHNFACVLVLQDTELRMAILQLVCCSIGTQPGILELFLSLKKRPDKSANKEKGGETIVYCVDQDSCLWPVLDMIDPELQVHYQGSIQWGGG